LSRCLVVLCDAGPQPRDDRRRHFIRLTHRAVAGALDQVHLGVRAALENQGVRLTTSVPRKTCSLSATTPPQRFLDSVASAWQAPLPELGRELLKNMLAAWADPEIGPVLRSIVQTAAHEPKMREKLSGVVEGSLMGVAELGGDPDDRRLRSGLVATQMIGFAFVQRYIEGDLWP
jgi:Tetracyclin repressor-like, C-terminal domain